MPNKSQPDTFLINAMLLKTPVHGIENNKYLLDWFAALEMGSESERRNRARKFLELSAYKLAQDMGVSDNRRKKLVDTFEPLDRIFVSALSLGQKGEHIREHLSHTIRNYLFSHYILDRLGNKDSDRNHKLLGLATIFHDLAYPIEKFKNAAHKLGSAFFKDFLDTKGSFEFELTETENFLTVLDFVGSSEIPQFEYLYKWVVAPAIAGVGLFDSPHNLSSSAMFIRSIFEKWGNHNTFWEGKKNDIAEICMAITFHDRKMNPLALPVEVTFSEVAKALRIADELQEWGRDDDENSYVSGVEIDEHPSPDTLLSLTITLKNISDDKKCEPDRFMADKIAGLLPAIGNGEKLVFILKFPVESIKPATIPTKENILKAYENNVFDTFLNEKTRMHVADINKKIICKYNSGGIVKAEFSNHKVTLT